MLEQPPLIMLLVLALFLMIFIVIRVVLAGLLAHNHRTGRLHYRQKQGWIGTLEALLVRQERLYRHLSDLLESVRAPLAPLSFAALSMVLGIVCCVIGLLLFQSAKGTLMLAAIGGLMPYTIIRMALLQHQIQVRIDFLPSVELFYQSYLVTGERHIRYALQRTIEERRLSARMQPVFDQLYRNLSVRGDDETSLRIFAGALGHVWGEYFVNLLRVSLMEGSSISDGLRELLTDMRRSRRANEQERNKLLEIRIANFTPVLFLILFVGLNVHYSPKNAYHYYLVDPKGRDLILNAIVLIFGSFLMGIWLSRRKM
ncbi:hypothetical protein PCCS19_52060 [Paenibacillus sp. CCS19]|nr:hypothetical protein PCCS19_52060 [Paenibacillus cellulosilyticus]